MKIDEKMVDHIAKLAMLKVSEKEKMIYQNHLEKVLNHINELEKVNTKGVSPFVNPMRERFTEHVLREDEFKSSLPLADVLKNAPEAYLNQFKVEAVIE